MDEKRLKELAGIRLDENLSSQETREIKELLSQMSSGDLKNLQDAYFKAAEGALEYPNQLNRLLKFHKIPKGSPADRILKAEIKAAEEMRRAFKKTSLGRVL